MEVVGLLVVGFDVVGFDVVGNDVEFVAEVRPPLPLLPPHPITMPARAVTSAPAARPGRKRNDGVED